MINQEKIENMVREFCSLRDRAKGSKDPIDIRKEAEYKSKLMPVLRPLVEIRSSRYKKFSNHPDLEQDGYEALMLALNSFDPNKGSFTWWADKYIATRISRCANAHSVIHIPIKQAREVKPLKVSTFPKMVDESDDPFDVSVGRETTKIVKELVDRLPHADLIKYLFGMTSSRDSTVKGAMERFKMTRAEVMKIAADSKEKLKQMYCERIG